MDFSLVKTHIQVLHQQPSVDSHVIETRIKRVYRWMFSLLERLRVCCFARDFINPYVLEDDLTLHSA